MIDYALGKTWLVTHTHTHWPAKLYSQTPASCSNFPTLWILPRSQIFVKTADLYWGRLFRLVDSFNKNPPKYCGTSTISTKMQIFKCWKYLKFKAANIRQSIAKLRRVWSSGKRKRAKLPDSVTPSNFRLLVFAIVTSSDMWKICNHFGVWPPVGWLVMISTWPEVSAVQHDNKIEQGTAPKDFLDLS